MSMQTYCEQCGYRVEAGKCANCGTVESRPAPTDRQRKERINTARGSFTLDERYAIRSAVGLTNKTIEEVFPDSD